jgi:hypothetical protein
MKDWHRTLQEWAAIYLERETAKKYYDLKKYYVLTEIFGKSDDDPDVAALHNKLVETILGSQLENGSWNNKVYNYEEGTTHQVMTLLDLGITSDDESVTKAVDYIFYHQLKSGAFQQYNPSCGVEANLIVTNAAVMALARAGYSNDPRVAKAYTWLVNWQQDDGSWLSPHAQKRRHESGYPYCYCGIHATCNALLGLSVSKSMRESEAAVRGVEYLLRLYHSKYTIEGGVEPPLYKYMGESPVPFEGAWHDPRVVPPEVGPISRDIDRKIEVLTTQHVLATLSTLGYGLEHQKIKEGHDRLLDLVHAEDVSIETLMAVKGLHGSFSAFSFHGH